MLLFTTLLCRSEGETKILHVFGCWSSDFGALLLLIRGYFFTPVESVELSRKSLFRGCLIFIYAHFKPHKQSLLKVQVLCIQNVFSWCSYNLIFGHISNTFIIFHGNSKKLVF